MSLQVESPVKLRHARPTRSPHSGAALASLIANARLEVLDLGLANVLDPARGDIAGGIEIVLRIGPRLGFVLGAVIEDNHRRRATSARGAAEALYEAGPRGQVGHQMRDRQINSIRGVADRVAEVVVRGQAGGRWVREAFIGASEGPSGGCASAAECMPIGRLGGLAHDRQPGVEDAFRYSNAPSGVLPRPRAAGVFSSVTASRTPAASPRRCGPWSRPASDPPRVGPGPRRARR